MKTLTAETYYKMLCSGANLLAANCETINNMNVFPVPDGDTGSNMTMTMSGVYHFQFDPAMSLGTCASGVAENMLRCARGNSGVILSVFFRSVARTLKEKETATIADFAQAMDAGVKGAYQAVMNPTEGTILSVMRAASECAAQLVELAPDQDFETLFVAIITVADAALDKTPEQLPKLKEAGVVDAGGYGFLGILNAMNQVLKGDFVPAPEQNPVANSQPAAAAALSQAEITYPYCTECIVEKSAEYKGEGKVGALHQFIEGAGDSAVFVDDDNRGPALWRPGYREGGEHAHPTFPAGGRCRGACRGSTCSKAGRRGHRGGGQRGRHQRCVPGHGGGGDHHRRSDHEPQHPDRPGCRAQVRR